MQYEPLWYGTVCRTAGAIPPPTRCESPGKSSPIPPTSFPLTYYVIPAQAGIHEGERKNFWIPACAGMTDGGVGVIFPFAFVPQGVNNVLEQGKIQGHVDQVWCGKRWNSGEPLEQQMNNDGQR